MSNPPIDYVLEIRRRIEQPEAARQYGVATAYHSEPVTTVTLDAEQWRKVQAAIVEALK
jgi:hypothetical protein